MQASGLLHLGNLIGALRNWVHLQDKFDCYFFIADWHALTTGYAITEMIKKSSEDLILNFLASGLDPKRCVIFQQSRVLQHAELHLLLSMITPLGWLERVPTYKEKKFELEDRDLNNYGFLGYPVLMSADILLYRAKYVPVGIDQEPHLEITREIARRFNHLYNTKTLIEPEALLTEFPKVIGVDGRKMSKTYDNALYLSDTPKLIETKIKTMKTDPARQRRTDKGDPNLSPVFELHKIFSSDEEREFVSNGCRSAEIGCIDCKKILIKNVINVLTPIWERREVLKSQGILGDILKEGNDKARITAEETMELVRVDMKLTL
ncbi:MAG: tryptophan--tRNA ligase [Nitrospirae bacterium]|nr:tryptophan--tRNA ligase [Nitrospirota bacterium]